MSSIAKWKPGKLYQPGDVVQPNEGPAISQTAPGNAGFESGDTGWTKESGWTIDNTTSWEGSYSADYAGEGGARMIFRGNTYCYSTFNGTTFDQGSGSFFSGASGIGTNSTYVVAAGASTVKYSDDRGLTETAGTPPSGWAAPNQVTWMPMLGKFWAGNRSDAGFFISDGASGSTWGTENTFPENNASATQEEEPVENAIWPAAGTIMVRLMAGTGKIYSSVNGIAWTLRDSTLTSSVGQVIWADALGKFFACGHDGSTPLIRESTDGITWATNGSENFSSFSSGYSIAWDNTNELMVVRGDTNNSTDPHLTSADGITWASQAGTATGSPSGVYGLVFSPAIEKFVAFGSSSSILTSTDGFTWTNTGIGGIVTLLDAHDLPGFLAPKNLIINDTKAACKPGQTIRGRGMVKCDGGLSIALMSLVWYDVSDVELSRSYTELEDRPGGPTTGYQEVVVEASAPTDAVKVSIAFGGAGSGTLRCDWAIMEQVDGGAKAAIIYRATQTDAGYSDTVEPIWPAIAATVVDNGVIWTGVAANCIVWEAKSILTTGATEPTWNEEVGMGTADNTILWVADDQRVTDEKCPNTKVVAIEASKIFCGDDDIVAFSGTVNPLDWSSIDDAGFIPFGLNSYGSQSVTALGLYRSNLVVWNNKAFQMWQVDEDPANMALLDAVPIGNAYYRSGQAVSNDLVFLTPEGIRNMGIAGASTNLQAGTFGKAIDSLIKAEIAAISDNDNIISLYYPGAGQYWIIFDEQAFVLTMNGGKTDMSWSRYVFPSAITDWTILDNDLYLRSGDKVWKFDEDELQDDAGGADVTFAGEVWWHYLDFGQLGTTKELLGFDTVATGAYDVVFGYNQNDASHVTTTYTISDGDTLAGDMIPFPLAAPSIQMRLTFTGNTAWEWSATALYLNDRRKMT